jgi:hypothetical protein
MVLSKTSTTGTAELVISTLVAVLSWKKTEMNSSLGIPLRNQEDLADSLMDLILDGLHHLARRMTRTSKELSNKLGSLSKRASTQLGMHFAWLEKRKKLREIRSLV